MHRRLTCGGIALLAAALLAACAPAVYTPQQLTQLKAKETVGNVVKQSRGSFVLRSDDGREQIYRTGEMTQYLPADYRSQQDDKVRVAYREVLERSGRIKYEVLQLEALAIPERNRQLPNPIVGRIVAIGPGGYNYARQIAVRYSEAAEPLAIYLPNLDLVVLRGAQETFVSDWDSEIGREVSVTAKRIPILRGNAFLYVAQKIVLPASE
jgi:hypothetical protein